MFKEKKKRIDLNTYISNPNPLEIQVGDSTRIVSSWPNNDISLTYRFSWNLRWYPFFNWDFPSEQLPFRVPVRSCCFRSLAVRTSDFTVNKAPMGREPFKASSLKWPPRSWKWGEATRYTKGSAFFPKNPGPPCQRMSKGCTITSKTHSISVPCYHSQKVIGSLGIRLLNQFMVNWWFGARVSLDS